ncbi:MAG: response regulator, partial [Planctomycetota bacterium]|nr:response regulator [Planctomycetota bacterium]
MSSSEDPFRILIVDDAPIVGLQLRKVLEAEGFQVTYSPDFADVLRELRRNELDLVFLDIELESDVAIKDAAKDFERDFPGAEPRTREVLEDWGIKPWDEMNGYVLLHWIKTVSPDIAVCVVTSGWRGTDDERKLNKWGAHLTILTGDDYERS